MDDDEPPEPQPPAPQPPARRPALEAGDDRFPDWLADVRSGQDYDDFVRRHGAFPALPQPVDRGAEPEARLSELDPTVSESRLDRSYYERKRQLNEIHSRAGFPLRKFARVTHMTRIFRSAEDLLRTRLRDTLEETFSAWATQFNEAVRRLPHGDEEEARLRRAVELRAVDRRPPGELIDRLIRSIPPSHFRGASRQLELKGNVEEPLDPERIAKRLGGVPDPYLRARERRRLIAAHHRSLFRKVFRSLPEHIEKVVADWGGAELLQGAEVEIDRLKAALRPGGRIHASPKLAGGGEAALERARSVIEVKPPQIAGNHECWLRLPDRGDDRYRGKANTLRVNWQLYSLSQDLTFYEDFHAHKLSRHASSVEDRAARMLTRRGDKKGEDAPGWELNTHWTALDTFEDRLAEHGLLAAFGRSRLTPTSPLAPDVVGEEEKFFWRGRLCVLTHFWIVPWEYALAPLLDGLPEHKPEGASVEADEPLFTSQEDVRDFVRHRWISTRSTSVRRAREAERAKAIIEELERFALKHYHRFDRTRRENERKDFIMSRFADGRAIGIADLRPYSRVGPQGHIETDDGDSTFDQTDSRWGERASRSIIVDFDLDNEQRGRVIKRFCDIATYRMLGLRDAQYFDAIYDSLNALGIEITQLSAEVAAIQERNDPKGSDSAPKPLGAREFAHGPGTVRPQVQQQRLEDAGRTLRKIGADLSSLNYFVTYGISGKNASTENYRQALKECCDDLAESTVPGYPTVSEYLKRFAVSAQRIRRANQLYGTLRVRLGELATIVNTETSRLQLIRLNSSALLQTVVAAATALIGAAAVLIGIATLRLANADVGRGAAPAQAAPSAIEASQEVAAPK